MIEEEPSFGPELFAFLRELQANNDRAWFTANKARYEADVKEPALAFVEDFELLLPEVSPHFKGKLFRIHRDTRFGRDKTPYKTHTGIHFRHEQAASAHSLGFYLHLEPGNCFAGFGIWRPEREALQAIRTAIARQPDRWQNVSDGLTLEGTALKRPPAGFAADHPLIDEIKRKDFVAMRRLGEEEVTASGFLQRYLEMSRDAEPFMRLLCDACGDPF